MRQTFSPLESLHRLSLMLGHAQEMSHEVRLFVDWLNQEAALAGLPSLHFNSKNSFYSLPGDLKVRRASKSLPKPLFGNG
jgi:hypothetical protein